MGERGVTAEECMERSTRILDSTERIELALFGKDRRGGISGDLSKVVMRLERIESAIRKKSYLNGQQENIDLKRFGIIITAISTIIATVISAVVNYWSG